MNSQGVKEHAIHNKFTTSPDCFLPFLITENSDEIICGNIPFYPVLSPNEIEELSKKINAEYPTPSLENGYFLNFAEMFSLSTSIYPLVYNNGHFEPIDKEFFGFGAKAVVILDPTEFIERLRGAVAISFPNLRFLEVASVQYGVVSGQWNLYNRNKNEAWKRELLITAKLNPMLRFESSKFENSTYAQPVTFSIGDLSQIAVAVPIEDLISGNFPSMLADKSLIHYLDSCIPKKNGIQNYSFSCMCKLKDIIPDKKWLAKFDAILGNEWVANTSVERLYTDGDALPRLVYHHINRIDKIHIGINRIDFSFAQYTDREKKIIGDLLSIIDSELNLRYCRMSVITNANLGTITEVVAIDNAFIKETKVKIYKGLQVTHDIETDYCIHHNTLGINSSQRAWHYTIKTETPEYETVIWYKLPDIINFFDEVSVYNREVIGALLRGDAYAEYRKI